MAFAGVTIDRRVSEAFPDARVGWLIVDVKVEASHPYVEELKKSLPDVLARRGVTEENLASHPDIAEWRAVFSAMGAKPSKYRSSLEALARRVLKSKDIWSVSSVVDLYDCVSVMTFLPMGAHDTARLDGVMTLRYARTGEKFLPLGTEDEVIKTDPRNIVYADETKICCWLWNHRDTRLASVSDGTKEAVFIADAAFTPRVTPIQTGLDTLAECLTKIGCAVKSSGVAR